MVCFALAAVDTRRLRFLQEAADGFGKSCFIDCILDLTDRPACPS